jgi:hypothetical protein
LAVWQELLGELYTAIVHAESEYDRLERESNAASEPVVPSFEQAHRAWEAFVEAECEYDRVRTKGTDAGSQAVACALPLAAARVVAYRGTLAGLELGIAIRRNLK